MRERLFPVIALMMAVFVLSAMMGATFLPVALAEGQEADELLTEEVLPDEETPEDLSPADDPQRPSGDETVIPPRWPVPAYVQWLLQVAEEEVGYTEGYAGYTKYGQWAGDPLTQWCAEYLCWSVNQVDEQHGTQLLKQVYPLYSASNAGRSWFIQQGRYIVRNGHLDGWGYQWMKGETAFIKTGSYIPQPGDWMFFTWTSGTDTDHVAMVEYCTMDAAGRVTIHVLEGNNPSRVARNTYPLTHKQILGYGTVHDVADVTMRNGNKGAKVRQLQEKLAYLQLLKPEGVDGVYRDETTAAVRAFQGQHRLRTSGIANQKTQIKLEVAYREAINNDPAMWMVVDEEE